MTRILSFIFIFSFSILRSQTAFIYGTVKDDAGKPLAEVQIGVVDDASITAKTDEKGQYQTKVPAGKKINIFFLNINTERKLVPLELEDGERRNISVNLKFRQLDEVIVVDQTEESKQVTRIDPKDIYKIASASGDFNTILFTQAGVASNNELSSGYSVRGGNFDENLVYVNDVEVYRSFLARSGQQEGLSFINPDMVSGVLFSAGGFDAKYGDKLSSVLDITYSKPTKFKGTVSGSLLGGGLHLEGITKNRIFSINTGVRYKNSAFIVKGLQTSGEYRPFFLDWQTVLHANISEKWQAELFTSYSLNQYNVIPKSRETNFGSIQQSFRFKVFFEGREITKFNTILGSFNLQFRPNDKTTLKFISSAYNTQEQERFTVLGQYSIDQLENDFGDPNFGKVAFNRGVGSFLNNGRNEINATVSSIEHKGYKTIRKNNEWAWGLKFQNEQINDKINEWYVVDSSDYFVPRGNLDTLNLKEVLKSKNAVSSSRIMVYGQRSFDYQLKDSSSIIFTGGLRYQHWSLNNGNYISPRISAAWKPNSKKDLLWKAAAGIYYQPPFYREFRGINGQLNKNIKAQQSIHFIVSNDYVFKMWRRPFKLTSAAYYKILNDMIPYEIDNTRLRYYANNDSKGYATGIDFRLNGEFIKGTESWLSLSLLRTREKISSEKITQYYTEKGDRYYPGYTRDPIDSTKTKIFPAGYVPRPTDQLVYIGMFFQDYLARIPKFQVQLNLLFGTGLPTGPPTYVRYSDTLRFPLYIRGDVGFSYILVKEKKKTTLIAEGKKEKFIKSAWISVEVLNLLGINNTTSYTWIKDITDRTYGVPNYLPGRQLNVKFQMRF
jgi:TonB-dependent Receptor Plug Domain